MQDVQLTLPHLFGRAETLFFDKELPDDVVFVEEIPKTSVGKFSKKDLRAKFTGYELPTS